MTQTKSETPQELEKRIGQWRLWLTCLGVGLLIAYIGYFSIYLGQNPAKDADKWGQFGDFFGGILNPLMAFAAFYWLTKSVKIQHTELAETKLALQQASIAQTLQARNSDLQVAISARTSLVTALQSKIEGVGVELDRLEQEINALNTRQKEVQKTIDKVSYLGPKAIDPLQKDKNDLNNRLLQVQQESATYMDLRIELSNERDKCVAELRTIVSSASVTQMQPSPA